jgi:D-3-phosphoglycerate dehydrogenase / 2-oxoglutarate reductase
VAEAASIDSGERVVSHTGDRPRLLVLNPTCLDVVETHRSWIESEGVELLADQSNRTLDETRMVELSREADGVVLPAVVPGFPHEGHMTRCPRLLVCAIAASGFEWLDIPAATRHGVVVTNVSGRDGAEVVADMAWALMLAVARQVPQHHQRLCAGDATRGMGTSVFGKVLGIVGLGHIGRAVARRAKGFKMRVLAASPNPDEAFAKDNGIEVVTLETLLEQADFVSLNARLTETTRGMIGARELARMKPTAVLINTARQELIDESALTRAILGGRLAGAGLDDPPGEAARALLGLPNVVFTPHIGNRAIEGVNAVFRAAAQSAIQVFRGERPTSIVNPEVYERGVRTSGWAKQ